MLELETTDPNFFELKTFMTGNVNEKEIRQIIFSSEEFQQNATVGSTPNVCFDCVFTFCRMLNCLLVAHSNMMPQWKMSSPLKKVI